MNKNQLLNWVFKNQQTLIPCFLLYPSNMGCLLSGIVSELNNVRLRHTISSFKHVICVMDRSLHDYDIGDVIDAAPIPTPTLSSNIPAYA